MRCSIISTGRQTIRKADIYDDTAWTMGELANVEVVRVTDVKVLRRDHGASRRRSASPGGIKGSGSVFLVNHNADNALVTLRYRLKDASSKPPKNRLKPPDKSSIAVRSSFAKSTAPSLNRVASELGIQIYAVADAPSVKTHPVKAARIAMMHTWLSTQDEGWWRIGLRSVAEFPYDLHQHAGCGAGTQPEAQVRRDPVRAGGTSDRRRSSTACRCTVIRCRGRRLSSHRTSAASMRLTTCDRVLGWNGLQNLQKFVKDGGVFITVDDTSEFAVNYGFTAGVSASRSQRLRAIGAILRTKTVDAASPIAYGYGDSLAMYCFNGAVYNSATASVDVVDVRRRELQVAARRTIRMCHKDDRQPKFLSRRRALSHGKRQR